MFFIYLRWHAPGVGGYLFHGGRKRDAEISVEGPFKMLNSILHCLNCIFSAIEGKFKIRIALIHT